MLIFKLMVRIKYQASYYVTHCYSSVIVNGKFSLVLYTNIIIYSSCLNS